MIRVKNIFKGKILDIINDEVMSHRNENVKTITTLKEVLEKIKQLKSAYYFKRESEHVSVPDSVGRELGEDIVADYLSPAFDISAMDGFAFRCEDNYPLKISGSVYAGDSIAKINNGEAMAIATGAILPEGADTVLKIEDAKVRKDLLYGKKLKTWENVFRKGSDYHAGMIKNTNAVLIQGFMKEMGCESTFVGAVQDDYNKTKIMLLEACEKFDVVFTTGGVSVGERDFVADVITEIG